MIPISIYQVISPDMLLIGKETYLKISDTNSIRWEALEYMYPFHVLTFLAFRIKNPTNLKRDKHSIHIVHYNLHEQMISLLIQFFLGDKSINFFTLNL